MGFSVRLILGSNGTLGWRIGLQADTQQRRLDVLVARFSCRQRRVIPEAGLTLDADENVYGTTSQGGSYGYGVVWEIKP